MTILQNPPEEIRKLVNKHWKGMTWSTALLDGNSMDFGGTGLADNKDSPSRAMGAETARNVSAFRAF
jgi:hypothetical protein